MQAKIFTAVSSVHVFDGFRFSFLKFVGFVLIFYHFVFIDLYLQQQCLVTSYCAGFSLRTFMAQSIMTRCCLIFCRNWIWQNGIDDFFLSFFFAFWVISPALRPYMIGPMCNPDIQHLLEAFASLKRGLQCNKARSSYCR